MNPQVARLLQAMEARGAGQPKLWTLSPEAARAHVATLFRSLNRGGPDMAKTYEISVPVRRGAIGATVYVPEGVGDASAGLLYLHGGGFVIMSPATHDRLARELAAAIGARVMSLDYGLAPEHPYPAALHDAVDATRWLARHAAELGIDPARMVVGGDSAGANLSVAAMLKVRDEGDPIPFRAALLLYGRFTWEETASFTAWGDRDIVLSRAACEWFLAQQLAGGGDLNDPYVSPVNAALQGLPPAVLVAGTLDPLLSDSELFADALRRAGVPAELHVFEDAPHAFMQYPMLDMTADAIHRVATFARRHLGLAEQVAE